MTYSVGVIPHQAVDGPLSLQELDDHVPCVLSRWSASDGTITIIPNAAATGIFGDGVPRGPIAWRDAFWSEDAEEIEPHVAAAAAGEPRTFTARLRAGREGCAWVRVALRASGASLIGSMVDIGAQRELETLLSRSGREWRAILDSVPMAVVLVDPRGRVGRLNACALALLGGDYRDVVDAPFESFAGWQPWASAQPLVLRALGGQGGLEAQTPPDASGRVWIVSVHAERTLAAEEAHAVVVAQEVTEAVRLRRDLALNERMASVGRVVAGVAHEVRNPLFGISAVVDALELRLGAATHVLPHLANLRAGVTRLTGLMNDLLALGMASRLDLADAPLADIVHDARAACAALAAERAVDVVIELPARPIVLVADRSRMLQAVQNLVDNAVRHAPRGTQVDVRVTRTDGDRIRVQVRDRGPGFGAYRARAFEPFYARRRDGIGLGLAIVQQIVNRHGGTVSLDDDPEGGAVVELDLPRGGPR